TGATGATGATGEKTIYLATDQSIADGQFFGLGTSQGGINGFARNTVVIPTPATITNLVFNIRDDNVMGPSGVKTAEIWVSGPCATGATGTGIIVTLTGADCCGTATGSFPVNQCDLLSVRVTVENGALENGATAAILFNN
ncbi:hypothetical protein ABWK42_10055, partial [Bacillus sp. JJ927]